MSGIRVYLYSAIFLLIYCRIFCFDRQLCFQPVFGSPVPRPTISCVLFKLNVKKYEVQVWLVWSSTLRQYYQVQMQSYVQVVKLPSICKSFTLSMYVSIFIHKLGVCIPKFIYVKYQDSLQQNDVLVKLSGIVNVFNSQTEVQGRNLFWEKKKSAYNDYVWKPLLSLRWSCATGTKSRPALRPYFKLTDRH